mmetsp:Transcript_19462/g.35964  ORF Transcript_19462/g.35964 Transcript_19462/m.35964 type:complete len:448 (-) Transcript_19462:61-1404(-)
MAMTEGDGVGSGVNASSLCASYRGFGLVERLLWLAKRQPKTRSETVPELLRVIKQSYNSKVYTDVVSMYEESGGEVSDAEWLRNVAAEVKVKLSKLKNDLALAQKAVVKENIRMALNDMGELHMEIGDYTNALRFFSRTRDYCTTQAQYVTLCINLIRAHFAKGSLSQIVPTIVRLRPSMEANGEDVVVSSQLDAIQGLVAFVEQDYLSAAESFLKVTTDLGETLNEIVICKDVAVYGGLCCVATFSRQKLKKTVLAHPTFRTLLESAPLIRDIIQNMANSDYANVFSKLRELQEHAKLDIYLSRVLENIAERIRIGAIEQYVLPFKRFSLGRMAEVFSTTPKKLEKELTGLIAKQVLHIKIDQESGCAVKWEADPRAVAFQSILEASERLVLNAQHCQFRRILKSRGVMQDTLQSPNDFGDPQSVTDDVELQTFSAGDDDYENFLA